MAKKVILVTAIEKLKDANCRLYEKCCKSQNEKEKERLREQISKNNSMILDYQYRLDYENET